MSSIKTNAISHYILKLARYNLKIIFGGKFVYFVIAAFLFFILIGTIMAFENSNVRAKDIYNLLIFPAFLLIFFPVVFGIQNDSDQRTLEIIFGIPDYRYKVWLFRFVLMVLVVCILIMPFAGIAHYALVSFPFMRMCVNLMVLIFFISSLGLCISTLVKNGYGSAVVMVILAVAQLIFTEALETSKWNILLNPFSSPGNINEIIWDETIRNNRIILIIASVVLLLFSLLNLQKREGFLK